MTAEQLDLLTDPALLARSTDPDTSHAGAVDVVIRVGSQKYRLLRSYKYRDQLGAGTFRGLADEEAAQLAGLERTGYWKRCAELRRDGLIAPTDEYITGSAGSAVMLCRITPAGIRALG